MGAHRLVGKGGGGLHTSEIRRGKDIVIRVKCQFFGYSGKHPPPSSEW